MRFPLILLFCLVFGLTMLGGCLGFDDSGEGNASDSTETSVNKDAATDTTGTEKAKKKPKKEKSIKINIGEVLRGDLVLPVYADGVIKTRKRVLLKSQVGGQLTKLFVKDGDYVRKGQIIAQIDPREYEIALEESRYRHLEALSQMAAEADTFQINYDAKDKFNKANTRLEKALKRGSITRFEYKAQLLELELASLKSGAFREAVFEQRTGLADARMAEERAKLNLDHTRIRAPFSGVVHELTPVQGEFLDPNTTICYLVNNDHLEATVSVLEADLGNLQDGRPVLLAIPATGDTIQARVDLISPYLDEESRTCDVTVRFDNTDGKYRSGMFARAQIAGFVVPDLLLVPKSALLIRDKRPLVFKKDGDRAKWLYVTIGKQNDDWVEILQVHSGGSLSPGDEVVISDHLTLAHEAKIKVRKRIPSSDRWDFAKTLNGESGK